MSLIEQLEKVPRHTDLEALYETNGDYVLADDLRAIIEQAKREAVEPVVMEPYYFIKVIGETDWYECTKTQYLRAKNLPEYDYKMSEIYDDELNPLYGFDVYKQAQNNLSAPQPDHTKLIGELVEALESDAYAASFQSMAQYRKALLTKAREAIK